MIFKIRTVVIAVFVFLMVALIAGTAVSHKTSSATTGTQMRPSPAPTRTVTRTVTRTIVTPLPHACHVLIDATRSEFRDYKIIVSAQAYGALPDILDELFNAIAMHDGQAVQNITFRLRPMDMRVDFAVNDIEDQEVRIAQFMPQCH